MEIAPATTIVTSVWALLAARSGHEERDALSTLAAQVQSSADAKLSWLRWIHQESAQLLEQFLLYTFIRTFAPKGFPLAEMVKSEVLAVAVSMDVLSQQTAPPNDEDCQQQQQLMITLLIEATWSIQTLRTLSKMIRWMEDPRLRQQVIQVAFTVVNHWIPDAGADWIQVATDVLLLGVTDVWSAVRKECARFAGKIAFQFPSMDQIDLFLDMLLKTTTSDAWKAQDGALLTLAAMLLSIKVDRTNSTTGQIELSPASTAVEMVKGVVHHTKAAASASPRTATSVLYHFGERHRGLLQLPRSLAFKLKPVLYVALKHTQTSVRETAAQCLSSYMAICDESTRILTFQEVMSKLNRLSSATDPHNQVTTTGSSDNSAELLDAAEAEGLLDVLGKLVPHLPVQFLLKHWKLVFPTLERYVMHIASSVRQRSSAVVLALAQLAQQRSSSCSSSRASSASLELLHQMMVALAELRDGEGDSIGGVCWQRLEGRLLSIDLLVGLLGKDHLMRPRTEGGSELLHSVSKPSNTSSSWLPDAMATQSTWAVDEEDENAMALEMPVSSSMIDSVNTYLTARKPPHHPELWLRVLGGWLWQTRVAFESSQFELRRIARQVLPGLVRLCLWCDQLCLVLRATTCLSTAADAKTLDTDTKTSTLGGWAWSCLRHLLLHTERVRAVGGFPGLIQKTRALVIDTTRSSSFVELLDPRTEQSETRVARVEAIVMATLSFPDEPSIHIALHNAILDVHANLPASFQHHFIQSNRSSSFVDASLDRQFSIALVQLLPAIIQQVSTTATTASERDTMLWWMLERTTLSWLATDDMFRWITIDKHTAQSFLVIALGGLLAMPHGELLVKEDLALVIRTIETAVNIMQLKENATSCLVRVYVSLWKCGIVEPTSSQIANKIVTNVAVLDSQQRISKSVSKKPLTSGWDDWDSEECAGNEEPELFKGEELRPCSSPGDASFPQPPKFSVADVLSSSLQLEQLANFRSCLDQLISGGDKAMVAHRDALRELSASLDRRQAYRT